jgi:uncharacterized membrane protein YkvA (DUF1232 family)
MSRSRAISYYGWIVLLSCLVALYVISPWDLFPDVFPGLGWIDDVLALVGVCWYLRRLQAYRDANASQDDVRSSFKGTRTSTSSEQTREEADDDTDPTASPENPWDVLQVEPGASLDQIHAAYTQQLLKYHPDRVAHLGEEFQHLAHRKTLAIMHAYDRLKQQKAAGNRRRS